MSEQEFRHRSNTKLKQKNKIHKTGKHETKSGIKSKQKGKLDVENFRNSIKDVRNNRLDRKNKGKLQRQKILQTKRSMTEHSANVPRFVGVISLNSQVPLKNIYSTLIAACEEIPTTVSTFHPNSKTVNIAQWKQRATFYLCPPDVNSVMDIAKVADLLLLVISAEHGIDSIGEKYISILKSNGVPTVIGILHGLENVQPKKRHDVKKNLSKEFNLKFPEEPKLLTDDNPGDIQQILRFVASTKLKKVTWREKRPYMFVNSLAFFPNESSSSVGTLVASGYLRGANLNVNNLVHIPDWGDFQLSQVDGVIDPYSLKHKSNSMEAENVNKQDEQTRVGLAAPDPEFQETLEQENTPDPLEGEQTWPTEEEMKEAEERIEKIKGNSTKKKKVPKGTSAYQAAWIIESDGEGEKSEEEKSDDEYKVEGEEYEQDMEDTIKKENTTNDKEEEEEEEEMVEIEESEKGKDEKLLKEIEMEEKNRSKADEENEQLEFPDEVETPQNMPARVRFQKYRGLKSFRTSPWDPKENLPKEYSKIFQFANFYRTKKRVMADDPTSVQSGQYVTLYLKNVPKNFLGTLNSSIKSIDTWNPNCPLVIGGLLKYENKISVLHFNILKHHSYSEPVKSKEQLIFHVGFRRYPAIPTFSQNTFNCDKHKYEKFLHSGRPTIATVYAPITFPSVPVIVLRDTPERQLVATGSLMSVNPDRIVLKKIILTGVPFKLHKKTTVVRDMFYDPADISWFKPVELWTKHGKTGHIKESLGTHGYMKCNFDGTLQHNDTVCMSLYKRVFPKWTRDKELIPTLSLNDPAAHMSPLKTPMMEINSTTEQRDKKRSVDDMDLQDID